jgi:hypothetical protein
LAGRVEEIKWHLSKDCIKRGDRHLGEELSRRKNKNREALREGWL